MLMKTRLLTVSLGLAALAAACGPPNGGGDGGADAGPGTAAVTPTMVDFGMSNCGAAGTAQTITVRNSGSGALTYSASVEMGSPFSIASGARGTVAANGMATISVGVTVPSTSTAGTALTGNLTITTNDPMHGSVVIPLRATPQGGTLMLNTTSIPFGSVPVMHAQSSPFQISNTGNMPVHVSFASSSPAFTAMPSMATEVAPGMNVAGAVTFDPQDTMEHTGMVTVTLAAGDAVCGMPPGAISVSGTGQNGGVGLSATSLMFGNVPCGTTAAPQTLTITNSGNAALTWSAALGGGTTSSFTIDNSFGSLSAGASVMITVTPQTIPAEASVRDNGFGDVLNITTNVVGDSTHVVPLTQTASGAILAFMPASLDFGSVPVTTTSTGAFQLVNTGNAPANVMLTSSNGVFSVPAGPTAVAANGSSMLDASFSPGTDTTAQTGTATIAVGSTDVLCAPLPPALALSGIGTNGSVAYSPASLAFGNTPCGTTATAQSITFTNGGNQDYTITPSLGLGSSSAFDVSMTPASGVVSAMGGTLTLTVTPHAIPSTSAVPGDYNDILTVSTTVSGDMPHQIQLTQNAYGVILGLSTTTLAFPNTTIDQQRAFSLALTNSGNAPAPVSFTVSGSPVFTFDPMFMALPGTSTPNAYFLPTSASTYSATATMVVASGTPICQPLPGMLNLSGTGIPGSTVTVTPDPLNFGRVNCGSTATAQTVTVQNLGGTALNWTASLANANGANFTLMPASGSIPAGMSGTFRVVPNMIAVGGSTTTAPNGFGDTLTVTTDRAGDSPHIISILESAQGAILSFNPASVTVGRLSMTSANFRVENTGNVTAPVTLTRMTTSGSPSLTVSPTSGNSAIGSPFNSTVTNTGGLLGGTGEATISVATTAPICQPLPTPLAVHAN
jgi:hypothetical protein